MNILVAESNALERRRLAGILTARGHSVRAPEDQSQFEHELRGTPPDVAICELRPGPGGTAWLSAVRAATPTQHVYIIAALTQLDSKSVYDAWQAGADDLVRRGAVPEEVIGRSEAPVRIRTWAGQAGAGFQDFTQSFTLEGTAVWRQLESLLCNEISEMLGMTFTPAPVDATALQFAAEVPLSFPKENVEARLSVGIDLISAGHLSEMLFGGPAVPDALADAMREFANTSGGAFKRAALAEGALFTMGLPASCSPFSVATGTNIKVFRAKADNISVVFRIAHRQQTTVRVPARDLREGMVLANEVRSPSGQLLVAAGTVLTQRTAERLVGLVGPAALFEVSAPQSGGAQGQQPRPAAAV